jgi:hypothetical protein
VVRLQRMMKIGRRKKQKTLVQMLLQTSVQIQTRI